MACRRYVTDTLDEAVARRSELARGERFVTPKGHVVDPISISFWAEESESAGVMSRAAEIRTLSEQSTRERDELDAIDEKLVAQQGALKVAQAQAAETSRAADASRNELHMLQVEYSALSAAIDAWREKSAVRPIRKPN